MHVQDNEAIGYLPCIAATIIFVKCFVQWSSSLKVGGPQSVTRKEDICVGTAQLYCTLGFTKYAFSKCKVLTFNNVYIIIKFQDCSFAIWVQLAYIDLTAVSGYELSMNGMWWVHLWVRNSPSICMAMHHLWIKFTFTRHKTTHLYYIYIPVKPYFKGYCSAINVI